MKKTRTNAQLTRLKMNTGQIDWLPKNPRQWDSDDLDRTVASIVEDPDFLEDRPMLAVENGKDLVVFAGNLRLSAIRKTKYKTAPVVIYEPETDEDRETVKRRAMKDNGTFGSWDWDTLANEWEDEVDKLADWGIKVFRRVDSDMGLTTKGKEGNEEYDEFVDKFKPKLTTDDCYTPPAVYDAVLKFVGTLIDLRGKNIERPFFPGGDYEKHTYTGDSIVVDNPPFSILSSIIRFYCKNGIKFFLFAPALTLFIAKDCDVTYIISGSEIVYENGVSVLTGFITNLIPDVRIWCCPSLRDMIDDAQPDEDKTKQGFVYPDNIVTSAILGKITKRSVELKIRKVSCEPIRDSDSAKEQGRGLYGGGFIMSDRAAAERAAATRLNLSDREREIIERLNKQDV